METPGLELRRYDGNTDATSGRHSATDISTSVRRVSVNCCGFFSTRAKLPGAAATPLQPVILRLLAGIVYR
jgi:hypothetical protein